MHETLNEISEALAELASAVDDTIASEESLGIGQSNWSFPFVSKNEIIARIEKTISEIESFGTEKISTNLDLLNDYPRRLNYIRDNSIQNFNGSPAAAYLTLYSTLDALDVALAPSLNGDPNAAAIKRLRNVDNRLRSREAQLNDLGPKLDELQQMVERIEAAYNAADQLPTDLKSLNDAREKIVSISSETEKKLGNIRDADAAISLIQSKIDEHEKNAKAVLDRCQKALSGSTSVGLAAAFSERSSSLGWSVWAWTALLVIALTIAGLLGFWRISELGATIADTNASDTRTILQFLLSIFSVGAPVWFAWLATRQIGQRFRIAEDYAFKASVSQAYEGYRREAARIDSDLEQQLLASALSRLDEQPLRLVERESPSSPIGDLFSSPIVMKAMDVVPDFSARVKELASESVDRLTRRDQAADGIARPPISGQSEAEE